MGIKQYSNKIYEIIPREAKLEKIATDFKFIEGPVWEERNKRLIFSDIPANIIYSWSADKGISIYRQPSDNSNGLTLDSQGRLLACEHGNRRLSRTNVDGQIEALATHFQDKRLNSPNDVIVKSDGSIYFTDPPYGMENPEKDQELSHQGVYKLDPHSGDLTLLIDDFYRPNGLAFSPDEKVLYIDDSNRQHVRAFDVLEDGTLVNGRMFAELDHSVGQGVPDGLKVDQEGNVYVTGPGGVWVISATGERLGVILVPEIAANVGWGGTDYTSLFITASTSLYRLQLNIPGIAP